MRRSMEWDEGERRGEVSTAAVWRGLVVGSLATLTGFWAPLAVAIWWLTR